MTREQRKARIIAFCIPAVYRDVGYIVDEVYKDIENYLKTQMNDQRRDFRDRCIFREILEHIGVSDDL